MPREIPLTSGEQGQSYTFRVAQPCTDMIRSANPMKIGDYIGSITTTLEAILITDKGTQNCRYHAVDRGLMFTEPLFMSKKRFAGGCGNSY